MRVRLFHNGSNMYEVRLSKYRTLMIRKPGSKYPYKRVVLFKEAR